uniref:DM13 domain-containing protein n=1 Tax=Glossina pallidipes TaxID=7398 RepID=A0A1A9ZUP0_GLOPL
MLAVLRLIEQITHFSLIRRKAIVATVIIINAGCKQQYLICLPSPCKCKADELNTRSSYKSIAFSRKNSRKLILAEYGTVVIKKPTERIPLVPHQRSKASIIPKQELITYAITTSQLMTDWKFLAYGRAPPEPYYGRYVGQFTNFAHGIKGSVYAVDESTLFVKSFAYDGTGPDAFFWVGKTPRPSPEGYIIPYPEDYTGM